MRFNGVTYDYCGKKLLNASTNIGHNVNVAKNFC